MGRIGTVLSASYQVRGSSNLSEVKLDMGGNNPITSEQFQGAGDDFQPLADDYALLVTTIRSGSKSIAGYIDPKNKGITSPGERRIYGRDSNGNIVNQVYLKNDGSILYSNNSGSIELKSDGSIDLNGVTIDTSGNISTQGNIISGTVSLKTHVHGINSGSSAPGPTSVPQ